MKGSYATMVPPPIVRPGYHRFAICSQEDRHQHLVVFFQPSLSRSLPHHQNDPNSTSHKLLHNPSSHLSSSSQIPQSSPSAHPTRQAPKPTSQPIYHPWHPLHLSHLERSLTEYPPSFTRMLKSQAWTMAISQMYNSTQVLV